jgi:tetratricopeptide (TPR) repeat protein
MAVLLRSAVLFLSIFLWVPSTFSESQEQKTAPNGSCCASLEELRTKFLPDNQYNEFIDALNNYKGKNKLTQPCLDYYKALGRYLQLKYLEDKQAWDEYFANGNIYRQELEDSIKKVIAETDNPNCLRPKTRLLSWQFHHDQQDVFAEQALADLMSDVGTYAKAVNDPGLLKDIADKLLAYEEKSKARQIYKLYVEEIATGKITEAELKNIAAGFYKEGNLDLAQSIYDIYIEKISKSITPEKFIPELFEIAGLFIYKPQGLYDMAYAEQIYAKIEGLAQKDAFNQDTIYLRAFNLEKLMDYKGAKKLYLQLMQLYPDTPHFDEIVYKIAMINVYASADINEARKYFEKLASKTIFNPQVISSFYQLGLLAQWEGDLVKARDYYDLLIKNSANNYTQTVAQAKDRLAEIQENKQISYNLKTFLDLSLKNASELAEIGRSELKCSSYVLGKNQKITVSSFVNLPQSGCNQVQVQYLWSGDLGSANPGVADSTWETCYSDTGTKAINIVIISSSGALDRFFTMLDVD